VFYFGFARKTAEGCFLISNIAECNVIVGHGQHAARESRVQLALLREYRYRYENLKFREYLILGFRRRSGVRFTLQLPLHRGRSLLYEECHFTNVFTGPVDRSDFIWWGLLEKRQTRV